MYRTSEAATLPSVTTIDVWCFGFFGQVARLDGARLCNLYPRVQPPENRYSRIYRGHSELIAGVPAAAPPDSIEDNPSTRANAPASDHRPLVATIDL